MQRLGLLFLPFRRRQHALQLGLLALELGVLLLDLVPGRLEFLGHGVEPHGQLADLGRAALLDPGGQVSPAQPAHRGREPVDWGHHATAQPDGDSR